MPAAQIRLVTTALRAAIGVLLIPVAFAVFDLAHGDGARAWVRLAVLATAIGAVTVALRGA